MPLPQFAFFTYTFHRRPVKTPLGMNFMRLVPELQRRQNNSLAKH